MSKWDELSMAEKAEMMKVAVRQGITNLSDIKQRYNEFAEGGNKNSSSNPITTSGAGYIPPTPDTKVVSQQVKQDIRQRLYDNIIPYGYKHPVERIMSALVANKPSQYESIPKSGNFDALDELWAEYLQIPNNKRHYDPQLKKSKYKPSNAKDKDAIYYTLPLNDEERQYIVNKAYQWGDKSGTNPELGRYKIDLGEDINGKYASYYDKWDINPFKGTTHVGGRASSFLGLDKIEDISMGIGKPVEVYDRIYFNERGQAEPSLQVQLPEVIVTGKKHSIGGPLVEAAMNEYKKGGSIHIKPSHRGRLTELKKRTGKTEAELYNDGNPAHKKMVVFARSARKWNKHDMGGYLQGQVYDIPEDEVMRLIDTGYEIEYL